MYLLFTRTPVPCTYIAVYFTRNVHNAHCTEDRNEATLPIAFLRASILAGLSLLLVLQVRWQDCGEVINARARVLVCNVSIVYGHQPYNNNFLYYTAKNLAYKNIPAYSRVLAPARKEEGRSYTTIASIS